MRRGGPFGHAAPPVWQALYDSPWHHPAVAWAAVALGAVALASRQRFLVGYLVLFGLEIAADALASSPFVSIPGVWGTAVAVAFVVLGDLRVLLWIERAWGEGKPLRAAAVARAVGLSLVVPLSSTVVRLVSARVASVMRLQFLAYEALFVALALVLRFAVHRAKAPKIATEWRRSAGAVLAFVTVQYTLWATADVLILSGVGAGYGLRLVPNVMYYALFLPFVFVTAPPSDKAAL